MRYKVWYQTITLSAKADLFAVNDVKKCTDHDVGDAHWGVH